MDEPSTMHTFGGRSTDRFLYDFETAMDADVGADGSDGSAATAAGDTGADAEGASDAAARSEDGATDASAPVWLESQEFNDAVARSTEATIAQILEQASVEQARAEAAARGNEPIELNPLADNFSEQLTSLLQRQLSEALAPLMPVVEQSQIQQADAWASHQLTAIEAAKVLEYTAGEDGKLADDDRQDILFVASGINQASQGRDPNAAMQQGAQLLAARDKRVATAAVERYKQHLDTIGNAPNDGARGGEGVEHLEPPKDEIEAAARFAARHKL